MDKEILNFCDIEIEKKKQTNLTVIKVIDIEM